MAMSVPDPFSSYEGGMMAPLWTGGPTPGSLYHFPNCKSSAEAQPVTHTLRPMVTGTSVVAVTFADGVMMAADTLGSYGSLARFRSVSRVRKVTENCAVAASGDYADYQFLERLFDYLTIESDSLDDGHKYTPTSLYSWLSTYMYDRRTKINPLWNTIVVGGYHDNKPFLGQVNSQGTAFKAPTLSTGLGSYIAQPLLRDAYEKNPSMTRDEAKDLLERCLRVLFYRDCRALNKYEIVTVSADGVEVVGPLVGKNDWTIASYVSIESDSLDGGHKYTPTSLYTPGLMESTIQLVPFMLLVVALFALMVRPSTSSQIPRSKSQAPNPGFRTAITNKGLSYVLQVGLPILKQELSSVHIPDISGSTHVNVVGKVEYSLKNIHLNDLTFGKSSLVTKRGDGLLLTASQISLQGKADWHYKIKVLFPISDSGSMDLSTSGVSLSVGVVIGSDPKGHATLTTKECSFSISHLHVKFHGGASWLYNLFDGQIAGAIKKGLNGQICDVASKAINDQGNKALESLPVIVPVDSVAAIDYALVRPPNFTDWYIETDHKGEFFPVSDTKKESPFTPPLLPPLSSLVNSTSCKMMYLWLTDYVANTAALVYQRAGKLHYMITPDMIPSNSFVKLDTQAIATFLGAPGLKQKYPNMSMQILLNTTMHPFINISRSGANFSVPSEAVFYVKTKNRTVPAFTISIIAILDAKAKLVQAGGKEVIVANATYVSASFAVATSDIGKIDLANFQGLFNNLANSLVIKQINKFLNKGLALPTVDGISFMDANISFGKGYVMVATDIIYKP
ncbi:bactericidal permeability-increasing protein-like [Halichondria panicea]|uniref:bactericidal permeability-increasing protein-like n=1 Tax=Halichondria panicea TaxID=6063 RepID=UPI00312B71C6